MVDRMWQMSWSWSWSSFSWGVCDGEWEWECREGVVGEDGERG